MPIVDAINAYRLFLGREPESERMAKEKAALPLGKMLSSFVGSREFSERVIMPLASGYPLPHFRVSAFPLSETVSWAAEILPLASDTREKLPTAKTWRDLLGTVVSDPGFATKIGRPANEDLLPAARKRVASVRSETIDRELVGGVDESSMFEIRGWAANLLQPDETLTLEIFLDNLFVGTIATSHFRRDMQEKIGGKGNFGFVFNVPAAHHPDLQTERLLTIRDSVSHLPVALPVRVRLGQTEALDALSRFRREVDAVAETLDRLRTALPAILADTDYPISMYDAYQRASRKALMTNRMTQAAEAAAWPNAPGISVIVCGAEPSMANLSASINSMRRQTYRQWECIVSSPPLDTEAASLVETLSASDSRIKRTTLAAEAEIAAAANVGAAEASGQYLLWLQPGDFLAEDALFELARAAQDKSAPIIYFDEDIFEREEGRVRYVAPALKTAFDHEQLLSNNYIGNAFACSRELYGSLGGFNPDCSSAYGYDFLLRASEKVKPGEFQHLERILYHGRGQEDDPVASADSESSSARLATVNAHLERTDATARAEPHADALGVPWPKSQRIIWQLPDPAPVVSIIIPTRDRADLMEPCLQSVFESQAYYPAPFEIIVMDNESSEPETHALFERAMRDHGVKVSPYRSAFNWSAINNVAAREARGDILLFLNNDTRVLTPDWVRELASHAIRPEVGAVGARLLYEDGTIQHAGVVLGGRAVHEAIGQRPGEGGYRGRTVLQRNVSAVTGACLATRKALFQELGGFDEINLKVAFNDVDYCLKLRAAGYAVVYTPFATLYHFESKSRGLDDDFSKRLRSQNELRIMRSRWHEAIERDPFYNSRFNRTGRPFTRLRPPELVGRVMEAAEDDELWELE